MLRISCTDLYRVFPRFAGHPASLNRDGGLEAPLGDLGLLQVEGAVWVGWEG